MRSGSRATSASMGKIPQLGPLCNDLKDGRVQSMFQRMHA